MAEEIVKPTLKRLAAKGGEEIAVLEDDPEHTTPDHDPRDTIGDAAARGGAADDNNLKGEVKETENIGHKEHSRHTCSMTKSRFKNFYLIENDRETVPTWSGVLHKGGYSWTRLWWVLEFGDSFRGCPLPLSSCWTCMLRCPWACSPRRSRSGAAAAAPGDLVPTLEVEHGEELADDNLNN